MSLSIYQLKPQFQRLLHPLVSLLAAARVTPNQMTVATAALMVGYGVALALWPAARGLWLGLVAVMPLRMALNALDGLLAHHTGRKTALGAMLNELCDVVSDLALYLPVALLAGVAAPLAILCAVGAAVVEFAGLSALAAGSPRRFDGPMGKSDRAVAYGLVGLLAGCGAAPAWIDATLGLVGVLLAWTLLNRLRAAVAPPRP
jgi:CDP-diacylglycerol--glycerol-3-phosphate 3-phosphatidyltransferase